MYTASAKLTFYIPYANSLKDKRQVSRSIIEKTRVKFNVSIAEVSTQDNHQTLTLGIALVSGDSFYLNQTIDNIIRFMEEHTEAELLDVEKYFGE